MNTVLKGFLATIGVLLALFIGLFFCGGLLSTILSETTVSLTSPSQNEVEDDHEELTTPVYKLGEEFMYENSYRKGKWNITNISYERIPSFTVDEGIGETELHTYRPKNGVFYVITAKGINEGDEAGWLENAFFNDAVLVSPDGKRYSSDATDSEAAATYSVYVLDEDSSPTNPGGTDTAVVLFDVPKESYKLCDEDLVFYCIEGIK